MGRNRGAPAWRAWLRNLVLPFADLGIDGGPGRALSVPDDIDLALVFPVLQTSLGSRVLQGQTDGALIVSPELPPMANVFASGTLNLAAAASQQVNYGFTAQIVYVGTGAGTASQATFTLSFSANQYAQFITASVPLRLAIPTTGVLLKNNAASSAGFWVLAFGN